MKKFLLVIVIIFLISTFFIVDKKLKDKSYGDDIVLNSNIEEHRAIFISYLEYQSLLLGKDESSMKEAIDLMFENMQNDGFNMAIVHVRSFSDAIYESDIFPSSMTIVEKEGDKLPFDILEYMINSAHTKNIEIHAWINPYRIRNTDDISTISLSNPAYRLLNTNHVKIINDKGIFYNPASGVVLELILSGISEIIENYDIDGIHFDDYFYPDDSIDLVNYLNYKEQGGFLSLNEYHLEQVNKLVLEVYKLIKAKDQSILFGISPEGNIDNNYEMNYADTRTWASNSNYVDYLMPQIYFGFENERKPYLETVKMWNDLITTDTVKLMPALAFYKVGEIDNNALSGMNEWVLNDDIIKKEVLVSRNLSNYQGFALFRYSYLYLDDYYTETTMNEINNLLDIFDE